MGFDTIPCTAPAPPLHLPCIACTTTSIISCIACTPHLSFFAAAVLLPRCLLPLLLPTLLLPLLLPHGCPLVCCHSCCPLCSCHCCLVSCCLLCCCLLDIQDCTHVFRTNIQVSRAKYPSIHAVSSGHQHLYIEVATANGMATEESARVLTHLF